MSRGHPILYAVLGFLTAPIGGAVAGYYYAKASREINELRGIPDESLAHNPFFAVCVGALFGWISGAIYGYQYGKKEAELTDLKASIMREQRMPREYDMAEGYGISRERGGEWRDRIQAEEASYQRGR